MQAFNKEFLSTKRRPFICLCLTLSFDFTNSELMENILDKNQWNLFSDEIMGYWNTTRVSPQLVLHLWVLPTQSWAKNYLLQVLTILYSELVFKTD